MSNNQWVCSTYAQRVEQKKKEQKRILDSLWNKYQNELKQTMKEAALRCTLD